MAQAANPGGRCETHLLPCGNVPPLFGLAPGGVYRASPVASAPVRSYRTLSSLPDPASGPSAVCFLRHFPWGHPRRALPATLVSWSPDFPRMQASAAARPPGKGADNAPRRFIQARSSADKETGSDAGKEDRSEQQGIPAHDSILPVAEFVLFGAELRGHQFHRVILPAPLDCPDYCASIVMVTARLFLAHAASLLPISTGRSLP